MPFALEIGRWGRLLCAGVLIGLAFGCGAEPHPGAATSTAPRDVPALGGIATSRSGRYRIEMTPARAPVALGAMHDWTLRLERTDGAPARPTAVTFDGGMPAHGHGFVTAPRVTRDLGDGAFLVEGVKFHMAGTWELRVGVVDAEGGDGAVLQIAVAP